MKDASKVTCCVVDHGLYLPVAQKLAGTFKRVLYHTPWEKGFPTVNDCCLGDGFENLERCDDIWKVKSEVDLFVFPDVLHAGLQAELRSQGYPVWGSGDGSSIELDRLKFLELLQEAGLELPTLKEVRGVSALRDHLKGNQDKFIKISKYRGTMETWHWRDWEHDSGKLDCLAVTLGSVSELIRFLVFDAIDTDIEIGGDTYCIDGQFPSHMMEAYEWKDKSAFGAFKAREAIADHLQEVLEGFGPILGRHSYRNHFSMELRIKGDRAYFIDPCCRGPMPMTGSQLEIYKNYAEIVWAGAQGELIDPEPAGQFCCECVLTANSDPQEWTRVKVPGELEGKMKISYACQAQDILGLPPDDTRGDIIGWLVAIGDTPTETLERQLEQARRVPDGIECHTKSLVDLLKEIRESEAEGLELTPQTMPEPEEAIED